MVILRTWTRRELMRRFGMSASMAAACATAPVVAQRRRPATAVRTAAALPPDNSGGGGGSYTPYQTLAPGDMAVTGFQKLNQTLIGSLVDTPNNLTFFRTGLGTNDITVLVQGYQNQVSEHTLSASAPTLNLSTAPYCTFVRNWGVLPTTQVIMVVNDGSEINGTPGPFWGTPHYRPLSPTTGVFTQVYSPNYTTENQSHPNQICTILNHAMGTKATYGPFRVGGGADFTRAGFFNIHPDFASAYLGGKSIAGHGKMNSGSPTKPFGCNMVAWAPFDPTTATPCTTTGGGITSASIEVIRQDVLHKQWRPLGFKSCGWNDAITYNRAAGGAASPGTNVWGGPDEGQAEQDDMQSAVHVRTSGLTMNKRGLFFAGRLGRGHPNNTFPWAQDADGDAHIWYGDVATNRDPTKNNWGTCMQDFADPRWGTKGPGCSRRTQHGWIYSEAALINRINGVTNEYTVPRSSDAFYMSDISDGGTGFFTEPFHFQSAMNSMWWDQQTNRVLGGYVHTDPTYPGYGSVTIVFIQVS